MTRAIAIALCAAAAGCSGTTGSGLVTFTARVGGPAGVTPGGPLELDSGSGYHVSLTLAQFHLGAVYLNLSVPASGGPQEPCVLPGVYDGQAFGGCDASGVCGVDLDLLSPTLTTLPLPGEGTANPVWVAEVWLTSGDINAASDTKPVFVTAGTASKGGRTWPFSATVTIGSNRQLPIQNPAMPGSNPICRQRIVSPICLNLANDCREPGFMLSDGGTLDVRVDPSNMFDSVDFAALTAQPDGSYVIPDTEGGVGGALFDNGVRSTAPYHFTFTDRQ
ncbi:MAG: hypothetical protein JWM53_1490 [bacterium]|nr:hypothetical protein [bacterium]